MPSASGSAWATEVKRMRARAASGLRNRRERKIMGERYLRHFMDQQILFLINRTWAHPGLDRVMAAFSSFDLWWPFLIALVLIAAIWGGWRVRAMLLVMGLAVGLTDGLVVGTLKKVVGRPRPHESVAGVRTLDLAKAHPRFLALTLPLKINISGEPAAPKRGNSFPSGHAGNTFAVATVCTIFYRRR